MNSLSPTFSVVGIGCSAGGLEALEQFFTHVPVDSGASFIVVQHLAPEHPSALPELLRRFTAMPVTEARDGMAIAANEVFVIPPNKDLSLRHGRLHLLEPMSPRGLRLPIDFFLRSLAEECKSQAIAVILSGMGSDGVFGLRAIKEKSGLTLVQDPVNAQADSMPRSAIEAGLADIVATADALPERLVSYLRHPAHREPGEIMAPPNEADTLNVLDRIIILLRERSGNDFTLYKTNTLYRRIERRMAVHQLGTIDDYVHYLRDNPHELDLLFRELLIGVTSFFRDRDVWDHLDGVAIPALLQRYPEGRAIRVWVPACSTGEEAYSLAIAFREAIERSPEGARYSVQIYATDLDADAIGQARKGYYPENITADVSDERLNRYFVHEEGGGYRIRKEIREMLIFAPQNIISDPPFTKLDMLSCRNLLIYFGAQLQKKILPLFYYALNRDGLLLLGSAESVGNFGHLFTAANSKLRLFRRLDHTQPMALIDFPGKTSADRVLTSDSPVQEQSASIGLLTDQLIQQTWAPAAVLVNAEGDILYISGRTGKYLEPAAGKTNINLHAMARPGLREALTGVIRKALTEAVPLFIKHVAIETDGGIQVVDLVVQALAKPGALRGRVIIVFNDVQVPKKRRRTSKDASSDAHSALLQELQQAREALQVTQEEMQTTVEELKSSNEELQSTNEELQSTNEELTTSKEELQSLNEELQTINTELQSKVDDLTWVRNDMSNLLNSTEIATIFLDNGMLLRRFTTYATQLFKLIPSDVGRPLAHVVTDLDYPELNADAQAVMQTLVFRETVASTHDGRWYRVRIMPYRTQDNVIDGVVITFTDITAIKKLEAELRSRTG